MEDVKSPMTTGLGSDAAVPGVPPSKLFVSFLRLGLTAFGGPAMMACVRELAVKKKGWVSEASFRSGLALCQSIPGATVMQAVAYVGLRAGGPLGALAAYVGFGLPAFVLMVILSALYQEGQAIQAVLAAFTGLQVIVVAIMASAAVDFARSSIKDGRDVLLAGVGAVITGVGWNPMMGICIAAIIALIICKDTAKEVPPQAPTVQRGSLKQMSPALISTLLFVWGLGALLVLDRKLFDLATLMARIDLFAFGGGFSSVPLMLHEVVAVRNWMDEKVFMDGIALGQVTPGPIVITATFVGHQIAGVLGAFVGSVAIFGPSFILLLAMVPHFDRLQRSRFFHRAIRGAILSFVGMLAAVTVRFGFAAPWTIASIILAALALCALRFKIDILWVVLAGSAVSAIFL
jgi:chromate transporter